MSDLTYREKKTLNGKRDRVLVVARQISELCDPGLDGHKSPSSALHPSRFVAIGSLIITLRTAIRDHDAYLEEIGEVVP